jgi:hypothetical protein
MRTALRGSKETLTAVVYFASFSVVVGAFKTVYAHSLRTGLLIAGTAFISGTLGFIYSVWRLYRPRWRRVPTERAQHIGAPSPKLVEPLALRVWSEVQEVLREGDVALSKGTPPIVECAREGGGGGNGQQQRVPARVEIVDGAGVDCCS